mgnify:CR=1 FL=1
MSACRSCGAQIVWATTGHGKAMPLDAEPAADGNVRLDRGVAVVLGDLERTAHAGPLYRSHHSTCPQAKDWRRA